MEQGAGGNEEKLLRRNVQAKGKAKADGGRDVKAIWKSTGNGQKLTFDEIREIQSGKSKYRAFKIEALYRKHVGAL